MPMLWAEGGPISQQGRDQGSKALREEKPRHHRRDRNRAMAKSTRREGKEEGKPRMKSNNKTLKAPPHLQSEAPFP